MEFWLLIILALLLVGTSYLGTGRPGRRFFFYLFWIPGILAVVTAIILFMSVPLFDQDLMAFPYYMVFLTGGLLFLALAQIMAIFGGRAWMSAQLAEERQQRAISEITQVAVSSTSLMELLNFTLDSIAGMLGMAGGAIHVFNRARQNLVLGSYKGISARLARRLETVDLGDTAIGKSARNKRLLIIRNLRLSPDYEIFGGKIDGFNYMALIPVISEGEHWGVITLFGKGGYTPGRLQVDLLEQFGEQLGSAMVLGRRMRATQSSLDNMKTLIGSIADELLTGSRLLQSGAGIVRAIAWSLTRILNGDRFDLCRRTDSGWVITLSSEPGAERRSLTADPDSEFDQSRPSGMFGWDQAAPFAEFMERRPYIFCMLPDRETWMFIRLESRRRITVDFDFFYDACRIIYGLSRIISTGKDSIVGKESAGLAAMPAAVSEIDTLEKKAGLITDTFERISHDLEKLIDEYSSEKTSDEIRGLLGWLDVIRTSASEGRNITESILGIHEIGELGESPDEPETIARIAIDNIARSTQHFPSITVKSINKSITLRYSPQFFSDMVSRFVGLAIESAGDKSSLVFTSESNGDVVALRLDGEKLPAPQGPRPKWISEMGARLECSSLVNERGDSVETWRLIFPQASPDDDTSRKTRILAVDTRDIIRDLLAGMLTQLGHEPAIVESSSEALRLFERGLESGDKFDIVIADNAIDELSGIRLAARMKTSDPDVFFILTPGWGMEPDRALAKKSGVDMIMEKPFRLEQLSEAIAGAGKKAASR